MKQTVYILYCTDAKFAPRGTANKLFMGAFNSKIEALKWEKDEALDACSCDHKVVKKVIDFKL